jgi:hypothetical protein
MAHCGELPVVSHTLNSPEQAMFLLRRSYFAARRLRANIRGRDRISGTYARAACCCISPNAAQSRRAVGPHAPTTLAATAMAEDVERLLK